MTVNMSCDTGLRNRCIKPPKSLAKVGCKGAGDSLSKVFRILGVYKVLYCLYLFTGITCGCGKRKELLNKLIPYKVKRETV